MTTAYARVRLSLVGRGRGHYLCDVLAEPYALEALAEDARGARPHDRLEVCWDGPVDERAQLLEQRVLRLAECGVDVCWIVDGKPAAGLRRRAEPRPREVGAPLDPPLSVPQRIGDLVAPADLPRRIAWRVVASRPTRMVEPPVDRPESS